MLAADEFIAKQLRDLLNGAEQAKAAMQDVKLEPVVSDDRTAFEAWLSKDGSDPSKFGSGQHAHYRNSAVNNAWVGWKAAHASAQQAVAAADDAGIARGFKDGVRDERKRNEQRITELEAALRQAVDALERVCIVDADYDILSPSLCEAVSVALEQCKEILK
jgi:hypothetical protein